MSSLRSDLFLSGTLRARESSPPALWARTSSHSVFDALRRRVVSLSLGIRRHSIGPSGRQEIGRPSLVEVEVDQPTVSRGNRKPADKPGPSEPQALALAKALVSKLQRRGGRSPPMVSTSPRADRTYVSQPRSRSRQAAGGHGMRIVWFSGLNCALPMQLKLRRTEQPALWIAAAARVPPPAAGSRTCRFGALAPPAALGAGRAAAVVLAHPRRSWS
jgi:hypothetical protein